MFNFVLFTLLSAFFHSTAPETVDAHTEKVGKSITVVQIYGYTSDIVFTLEKKKMVYRIFKLQLKSQKEYTYIRFKI